MSRPGLAASRSIDIIEFLALFPERGFTLSEIVRSTGINIASCHAVLTRLTERGYLNRSPEKKTYSIGPSLIAVGQAGFKSLPIVARAKRAAETLLSELAVPVLVSTVVGDEILALISLEDAQGRSAGMWVGERLPLVPPLGAPFLAWASDDVVEAWIARRASPPGQALSEEWRRNLLLTRQRGFQVGMRSSSEVPTIASLMAEMAAGPRSGGYKDELARLINSLDRYRPQPEVFVDHEYYDVMMIAAPIFGQDGHAAFTLSLGGFPQMLTGSMINTYADHLMRTCVEVMRADRSQRRPPERPPSGAETGPNRSLGAKRSRRAPAARPR